jgi:hypothetical protein
MARPKSLIVNAKITVAGRAHNCHHNREHRIEKGEKRLTIKSNSTEYHYCLACSKIFLKRDLQRLDKLLEEVCVCTSE